MCIRDSFTAALPDVQRAGERKSGAFRRERPSGKENRHLPRNERSKGRSSVDVYKRQLYDTANLKKGHSYTLTLDYYILQRCPSNNWSFAAQTYYQKAGVSDTLIKMCIRDSSHAPHMAAYICRRRR